MTYKKKLFTPVAMALLVSSMVSFNPVYAESPSMDDLKATMKKQLDLMKPELKDKVQGLSPDTKMLIMSILAMHNRYSDKATLRQVMLEVLQDYQGIVMGIMTDSSEMAADSARRLANHRIPMGGLLPYMGMENITDERLALLESFNDAVEGNAIKLAKAADADDMTQAASLLAPITSGCVACHETFRNKPLGASDLLK